MKLSISKNNKHKELELQSKLKENSVPVAQRPNIGRNRVSIPPNQSKQQEKSVSKSERKSAKRNLFDGLTFLIEVFEDNQNQFQKLQPIIVGNGGIIVKQLAQDTAYFVFQNGRRKVLLKALNDWQNVKVVNPTWIDQSIAQNKLLDHLKFKPIIQSQQDDDMINDQNGQSKKRAQPSATNNQEKVNSPMKTKRKLKIIEKRNSNNGKEQERKSSKQKTNSSLHQLYDPDELDKTIQEIQEERFFKKEFAKDLKKFSKFFGQKPLQQQQPIDLLDISDITAENGTGGFDKQEEVKIVVKKQPRYMNQNQLIESYIDGDIELYDVIENMENKNKKGKHRRGDNSTRRISEMFGRTDKNQNVVDLDINSSTQQAINRSVFVNLNDFLQDIDKENTPIIENQPKQDQNMKSSIKTGMNSSQQKSIDNFLNSLNNKESNINLRPVFNHKPQSIFNQTFLNTIQENSSNRVQKSQTYQNKSKFDMSKHINTENNSQETTKNGKKAIIRRAHSARKPLSLLSLNELYNQEALGISSFDIQQNSQMNYLEVSKKQRIRSNTKAVNRSEKKSTEPTRKMPTRGCKNNVSYNEKLYDFIFDIGNHPKSKRKFIGGYY